MAAVLCKGVSGACSGICDCIGAVCMAPFKLCGACCDGLGQCCGESCKLVANCCSTSFCFYITVTTVLNLPPIIVGLLDIPNVASGCQGSLWLLVFWLLCAVNIVAAFYMSVAIQKDETILPQTAGEGQSSTLQGGSSRVKQLFCYDGWMAAYILVLMGFFGWLVFGAAWFATGSMDDNESCDDINQKVGIAYAFGWAFVFCGGCAMCMSLCCGVFSKPPPSNNYNSRPAQQQASTTVNALPAAAAAAAPVAAATTVSTKADPVVSVIDSKREASAPSVAIIEPVQPSAPSKSELPVAQATLY